MRALMPASAMWNQGRADVRWREQGLYNLALARLGSVVDLDERYNTQCLVRQVSVNGELDHTTADYMGKPISVLHFNGPSGKVFYEAVCRGRFTHIDSPVFGALSVGASADLSRLLNMYVAEVGAAAIQRLGVPHNLTVEDYSALFTPLLAMWASNAPKKALVSESRAGVIAIALNLAGCTDVHVYSENKSGACKSVLSQLGGSAVLEEGDVASMMALAISRKETYPLVSVDLCCNTRHATTAVIMAGDLLEEGGTVVIHDLRYPSCDFESVLKKLRDEGWKVDAVSMIPYGPGLYVAQPPKK
jgi:hypothetical protein